MNLSGGWGEQGGKGERRKGSGWQVELGLREGERRVAGGRRAMELQ